MDVVISWISIYLFLEITVGDNDRPNAPSAGDVDSRFFNIDFGNISLGGVSSKNIIPNYLILMKCHFFKT